ncbi:hypothetical protein GALMADRAFT_116595 [Galerina marginata CBS 339.88]|uniref:Uncharacterized protein n=1 Tax=Galerina marginata (strain CBS 339.88) TaxID=685588 RepID=A0A067TA11_GALM3|nr:hypothetical protein GALMADRAFT_116595 [Galerina marginata CBS 339.88]
MIIHHKYENQDIYALSCNKCQKPSNERGGKGDDSTRKCKERVLSSFLPSNLPRSIVPLLHTLNIPFSASPDRDGSILGFHSHLLLSACFVSVVSFLGLFVWLAREAI